MPTNKTHKQASDSENRRIMIFGRHGISFWELFCKVASALDNKIQHAPSPSVVTMTHSCIITFFMKLSSGLLGSMRLIPSDNKYWTNILCLEWKGCPLVAMSSHCSVVPSIIYIQLPDHKIHLAETNKITVLNNLPFIQMVIILRFWWNSVKSTVWSLWGLQCAVFLKSIVLHWHHFWPNSYQWSCNMCA